MQEGKILVKFNKKSTIQLADNEKVSLWDDLGTGFISCQPGKICLCGTWRVSALGNFISSGLLGAMLIRWIFEKLRTEEIPIEHIERVLIGKNVHGGKVYHIFQSREGGMSEIHVFTAYKKDEEAIDKLIASMIPPDRVHME